MGHKHSGGFVVSPERIAIIENEIEELFERVENIEKQMKEDKITVEACKGAIEALKQGSCEDAISRQAALSKIDGIMALNHLHSQIPYFTPHRVKLILDELPPITPARPTGRWQQLKETIMEIKDNNKYDNDTATEICGFLLKYMRVLENEKEQI